MRHPDPIDTRGLSELLMSPVSRRRFLEVAGAGAVALGVAACGGSSTATSAAPAGAAGKPKRGGTLTFGSAAGSSGDTLDGQAALGTMDWGRSYALYSGLARIDPAGKVDLWLAEEITPNADATEWTVRIPAGVTTHKGKPFTSRDVLYSLRRIVANQTTTSLALGPIDLKNSKVIDARTLLVKYKKPFSIFAEVMAMPWSVLVPEGFDPKDPDGTGPFMYKSFTPGTSSTFVRFPDYWEHGKPYLDELVILDLDGTAQVNALQSGQVDLVDYLDASELPALQSAGAKLYEANRTGNSVLITFRVDDAPYSDVRVRQALRLCVDRPAMLRAVFGDYGTIGNDILCLTDPLYDTSIPQRVQDISQAKSLLAAAGHSSLNLQCITTASASPGATGAIQLFASQAKQAGVNVNIVEQTSTEFYAKSYTHVPFGQDFFNTLPYFVATTLALIPGGAFNTTHQNDAQFNSLYAEATKTVNLSKQRDLAHQMQMIEYERGGNIAPMFFPGLDASSQKVQGIVPSGAGTGPNAYDWSSVWLDD